MNVAALQPSLALPQRTSTASSSFQPSAMRLPGIESDQQDQAVKRKPQIDLKASSSVGEHLPLLQNSWRGGLATKPFRLTLRDLLQNNSTWPIELLFCANDDARVKELVKDVAKGIKNNAMPTPVERGSGGVYIFRNKSGDRVAVLKPADEEPFAPNNPKGFVGKTIGQPGIKNSVRIGEMNFREVAAYLLDYKNFANVPPTALVKIVHSVFHVNDAGCDSSAKDDGRKPKLLSKIASLQQFVPHDFDASEYGPSTFPVAAVHRIGILDIRIFNTDRHAGNLLVRKIEDGVSRFGERTQLIPIDHGLCLPEGLEDPYFEWINWPQASIPFSEDELDYISDLDPVKDCEMLRRELPMIREACLRVLVLCTIFLKQAAAFGLCLSDIGEMMSRDFSILQEGLSEFEDVCMKAWQQATDGAAFHSPKATVQELEEDFQFHMEYSPGLSTLVEESNEENEESTMADAKALFSGAQNNFPLGANSSAPPKTNWFRGKKQSKNAVTGKSIDEHEANSGTDISDVKLADMRREEWQDFLEHFQNLLPIALIARKTLAAQKQKPRLGTSCNF
ncbi:phosphatidylinositol 4-kinase gamma 6-like [Curcuma longa]|uniref:phosphatidylinositol 4-kinase gamma 6-like n=1 Tax=Curcuma longa TaxID=136217 RepID=UPI003D9F254D